MLRDKLKYTCLCDDVINIITKNNIHHRTGLSIQAYAAVKNNIH